MRTFAGNIEAMKAFSIQQPWASLIACGLKDVENRKWALKTLPVRILIHAGARRRCKEAELAYIEYLPVENYQTMGILPSNIDELPLSAIVGVATIDKCVENHDSIWAQEGPGAEYKWVMRDVKMFKEPITGVKGALGLFDIPSIDENNLPEAIDIPEIVRDGTTLTMPVNDKIFEELSKGVEEYEFIFNLLEENLNYFCDDDLNELPTDVIIFTNKGREIKAFVSYAEAMQMEDAETGEPIMYNDYHGNEYAYIRMLYILTDGKQ